MKVLEGVFVFFGIVFLLLSAIFFIAAFSPFSLDILVEAIVLLLIALVFFFLYYRSEKIEANRPVEVHQEVNISTSKDLAGEAELHDLKCKHCGATLSADDIKITDAGVIVKCPYCGAVYRLEEEPKW